MLKFIEELLKQPNALEAFLSSQNIKTHADVEYWTKYWEFRGL
jgi:hypothetical protein